MGRKVLQFVLPLCLVVQGVRAGDSAFVMVDDVVTVEAENLAHSSAWVRETTIPGFTGSGYLRYAGPRSGPIEGNDVDGSYQGNPEDRLVIPVLIEAPGAYFVNVRSAGDCAQEACAFDGTGDVNVWTHVVGLPPPVRRNFNLGEQPGQWSWMAFGPGSDWTELPAAVTFRVGGIATLQPGVIRFYVAPLDPGYRADRISIYRKTGPGFYDYPEGHCSADLPESPKVAIEGTQVVAGQRSSPQLSRGVSNAGVHVLHQTRPAAGVFDLRGRHVPSVPGAIPSQGAVVGR